MLYADTSALVKLVLTEDGTEELRSAAEQARETFTATVAYAELRAAVAAAIRDRRVATVRRDAVMALLAETWENASTVEVDDSSASSGRTAARAIPVGGQTGRIHRPYPNGWENH